jgi:hypothetical protein
VMVSSKVAMKKIIESVARIILAVITLFTIPGCAGDMTGMSRSEAGRRGGYDTLDLTIGVLAVSGSLNPFCRSA